MAFKIYPNPANHEVTIAYNLTQSANITIFDLMGRAILTRTLSADRNTLAIDLNQISEGTYLVQVQLTDGNKTIKRLVIQ